MQRVIDIALAEVGYLEKSKAAYKSIGKECLYEKTKYAGSDNYTKYGYEMNRLYPSVMDFPAAWCDAFVDYCFYRAYGVANAKAMIGGHFDDYTKNSARLYIDHEAFFYAKTFHGRKGDQVFFSKDGTFNGIYHTGLIYDSDDSYIYTVEGNTSSGSEVVANGGAVCKKQYRHDNAKLYGFGRPNYGLLDFRWIEVGGYWYYQDGFGNNTHGWRLIQETGGTAKHWYYFDDKGRMLTGAQWINGCCYYLMECGDLEGACCKTDDSGALEVWYV